MALFKTCSNCMKIGKYSLTFGESVAELRCIHCGEAGTLS